MSAGLDVICMGAVNYDYMFHCTEEDINMREQSGNENLRHTLKDVEANIDELLQKRRQYSTQIGGSAFITLKVVKHILPKLKVAYVGVCGTPNEFDLRFGRSNDVEAELSHLDDREWLFTTKDYIDDPYSRAIGKSVVRLYNHSRNCIKITACANSTVRKRIAEKEAAGGNLSEYLSQAKWIHLSSLSDFNQFKANLLDAIKAKAMNPEIKISVDPGFEFTSKYREQLRPLMTAVDYVFLNRKEKRNLAGNPESESQLEKKLYEFFDGTNCTLIVKYDNKHEIVSFGDREPKLRMTHHTRLEDDQMNNDTGAGDSLAGGFIAGMLDERLNDDIAGPIQLGVLAAKGRMISFDHQDPYLNIQKLTDEFFTALEKENK